MTNVTVHHAKAHLSSLIAAAERGEDVVILRRSTPVARITPIVPVAKAERRPGRLKGRGAFDDGFFDPLPDDELRLWEGGED